MLQKQSVSPQLFELLENLMKLPEFSNLNLVGGTSLALQIGHRVSVDIDMFGEINLSDFEINTRISELGNAILLNKSKNIFVYSINNIKVDFVNYPYRWLDEPLSINGIRLASKKDIAAMKLNTIAGRGSKKDFVDLYFLLKEYDLKKMIGFYNEKYPSGSEYLVLKSLTYFEDADNEPEVKMLVPVKWEEIKKTIINETKHYFG